MKKLIVCLVLAVFIIAGLLMASTESIDVLDTYRNITLNFDNDVNNATVTLSTIVGYIDGVVIDSAGTDTSFKVYVKDEHGIAIFSKTDCTSASEPYRYAISASDTGSTEFMGVPVFGTPQIQIADANDATLTNIIVYLYCRDLRR